MRLQMDKVKYANQNLSLRKSLVLYIVIFMVLAIFLSIVTAFLCDSAIEKIRSSYPLSSEKYYLTNERGEQLGEGAYIGTNDVSLSKQDERIISLLEILPLIAASIYSALCIISATWLFYRRKLKTPLAELQAASEKIANNDLDFSVQYQSKDELGQLCSSFEIMRSMLVKNFSEMWRQVEERKQLNAAFAHDLRTPLTVVKGYNEILQASETEHTRKTAATMEKHIARMEAYINSMSRLQRLEDAQPNYKYTDLQLLLSSLQESAEIVCSNQGKSLSWENKTSDLRMSIDASFISRVINNLISNAVRYANTEVILSVVLKDNGVCFSVADDGKGFDKDGLIKAVNPYFTEEENRSEHFGLGLYIAKILCERHGGRLQIENTVNGAKVTAFFKIYTL